MKAYKVNPQSVNLDELPCPPGYGPFPVGAAASSAPPPPTAVETHGGHAPTPVPDVVQQPVEPTHQPAPTIPEGMFIFSCLERLEKSIVHSYLINQFVVTTKIVFQNSKKLFPEILIYGLL